MIRIQGRRQAFRELIEDFVQNKLNGLEDLIKTKTLEEEAGLTTASGEIFP